MPTLDLSKTASALLSKSLSKHEPSPRLIRVLLSGAYIASTTSSYLVWEVPYYPQYYLPLSSISPNVLTNPIPDDSAGYTLYDVHSGSATLSRAAFLITKPSSPLKDLVRFDYRSMDGLFEEDDPIDGHPADPYKRIDTRRASRPITIEWKGKVVAETSWAVHLYETSLPVRYYLPRTSVKWEFLRPSQTRSFCPYKGEARYFDIVAGGGTGKEEEGKDLVWWYPNARMESLAVQNMLCFYNEKVEIILDGERLDSPKTHFV